MSPVHRVPLPEWLCESFFREIYERREELQGKPFQLSIVQATNVVNAGDNYCAQMYRVQVQCKWQEQDGERERESLSSFIVKAAKASLGGFVKERHFFGREFEMYRSVIPRFEEMWREAGEEVTFGPKCLKLVEGDLEIIVLSDLKDSGFAMKDRHQGIDEHATLLILEMVAKFHAASVVFREKFGHFHPVVEEKYVRPSDGSFEDKYTKRNVELLADAAEELGLEEGIVKAIKGCGGIMRKEIINCTDPESSPEDFQCLCHGDLWLNNVMFKETEEGKVEEVILIDFQISHWNRPEGDLFYFLASSVATEVLVNRYDFFLRFYHGKLIESLGKLKAKQKGPLLKKFLMQMLRNDFLMPRTIICILPVILMDKTEAIGLEDLLGNSEKKSRIEWNMFHNSTIGKKLKLLLPFSYDRGMFDSLLKKEEEENEGVENGKETTV